MRRLFFTLMLLVAPVVLAQTVYRWVDENGVVHYSDQPHPSAEKIHVKTIQTYKSQPGAVAAHPSPDAEAQSNQPAYVGCSVVEPADGSDFANPESLGFGVATDPALRPGDQVYLLMDGTVLNGGQPTGGRYTLSPVERGTHTVQAVIRDTNGAMVCQTPAVHFSVHQPSIQNPVNPVR